MLVAGTTGGCLNRPIDRLEPRTTSTVVERLTQSSVDKIDLVLAIDNSISMADKQAILADAVPDLVDRLVRPICVNPDTGDPQPGMPTPTVNPMTDECDDPAYKPQFPPIKDINIGIISSSLGALTANQCDGSAMADPTDNDKGRLLSRTQMGTANTYQNKGFLAWDPAGTRPTGPGESNPQTIKDTLTSMVVGVGQVGCGYEMQLESVYRFLVDPDPYDTVVPTGNGYLTEMGTDQVVLQQRADFLRANSLLAVIILTDENDCSVNIKGQGHIALNSGTFYKATDECAADPNDRCCTSCALPNPSGCAPDTNCGAQGGSGATKYNGQVGEDHPNLRCYEQKRRYGVDFLYPVKRYINAFTRVKIDPENQDGSLEVTDEAKAVQNPIFSDLSGAGVAVRDPGLVFIAGIVGVPWQAIARSCPAGQTCNPGAPPDLTYGFKTYNEMAQQGLFEALVGDPDAHIPPTDPFMKESISKRSGMSALTGASLPGDNPINGRDRNIPNDNGTNTAGVDLQYACIFPLPAPQPNGPDCGTDCSMDPMCDDPLCNPANKSEQINAKAYPGLRELALLQGMKDQGIFASICPQQLTTDNASYGYRPAVATIIDRLKQELGGQCLPRKLTPDNDGNVPCLVLEATKVEGACVCDAAIGRKEIPKTIDGEPNQQFNAIRAAEADEFNPGWNCFCEIQQLQGDPGDPSSDKYKCQNIDPEPPEIQGWCYVDSTTVPPTGNPELVAACPPDERRLIRFVNDGLPQPGATVFITCTGE